MSKSEVQAVSRLMEVSQHLIHLNDEYENTLFCPVLGDIDKAIDRAKLLSEQGYEVYDIVVDNDVYEA